MCYSAPPLSANCLFFLLSQSSNCQSANISDGCLGGEEIKIETERERKRKRDDRRLACLDFSPSSSSHSPNGYPIDAGWTPSPPSHTLCPVFIHFAFPIFISFSFPFPPFSYFSVRFLATALRAAPSVSSPLLPHHRRGGQPTQTCAALTQYPPSPHHLVKHGEESEPNTTTWYNHIHDSNHSLLFNPILHHPTFPPTQIPTLTALMAFSIASIRPSWPITSSTFSSNLATSSGSMFTRMAS